MQALGICMRELRLLVLLCGIVLMHTPHDFVVAVGPSEPRSLRWKGKKPTISPLKEHRLQSTFAGAASVALLSVAAVACRQRTSCARQAEALMPWRIPNTQRFQWLSVRELLLRERILMISEYIDDNMANAYLAMLLYLQSEDAKKPVQIYFSSPGAALKPALALYDTICQLKAKGCKVTTVSYSLCAGMGAFLVAAGSFIWHFGPGRRHQGKVRRPGRRFATPNSLFLLSKTGLESPVQGQATEIELEARQMLRESNRVEEELSSITGQAIEKIRKDLQRNFYLSAEEAAKYGLIDKVLVPQSDKGSKLDQGTRDPWSGQVVKPQVGFGVFADPDQPRTAV
ncbi:unnamed protein product [Durusdinium trenchii]|uniref:ATP-dependent Clp protease proteolytic subunit n=1 Tax=Durusdinium trenchii TaxID=1381693 RepID=A0ABP0IZH8_9DINO